MDDREIARAERITSNRASSFMLEEGPPRFD
jgi:hypothetical protein